MLGLDLLTDGEGRLALEHVGGDGGNTLADGIVGGLLEVTTLGDGDLVGLKRGGDGGILGSREDGGDGGNLAGLLESEGEPVLLLGGELVLAVESDGGVEEGRGGGDDDALSTEGLDGLTGEGDGGGEVVLPDVTSGDDTEGEDDVGRLDGSDDGLELSGLTVDIDVEASDGELGDKVDVAVQASEVGGEDDLGGNGGELSVGGGELLLEGSGGVEDEDGLVDLDPLGASSLQVSEEGLVEGEELGEEGDGLEVGGGLLGGLSKSKERDGAQDDGAGLDSKFLGLLVLNDGLVEDELEVGLLRELRDDKVVVGVEPSTEQG